METLAFENMLNGMFQKSVRHLLNQKAVAKYDGHCAYRGDDGLKCAVGCLIPDDLYDPGMEDTSAQGIIDQFGYGVVGVTDTLTEEQQRRLTIVLTELQDTHDDAPIESWRTICHSIARDRGLTMPSSV